MIDPSFASFKGPLQARILKALLHVDKIVQTITWKSGAFDFQVEASNALVHPFVQKWHAKEIDTPDEFGAVQTTEFSPDGISCVFLWKGCNTSCEHSFKLKVGLLLCEAYFLR